MSHIPQHRIALITGGLNLGGSTTFLINLAGELIRQGLPVEIFSFELDNPMASDFKKQNIPVLCLDQRRTIFEDRLKIILERLAQFQPTVVVSTLGAVSFEVLRYLPKGVFRIGMGQSDDSIVYDMIRHYVPWLDTVAMVSKKMCQKAMDFPEFAHVPIAHLPYGVPMSAGVKLPTRSPSTPLRILYLGRLEREQKRVHLFPRILRDLEESRISFHWTIAGEGAERDYLNANLKTSLPGQTISFADQVQYSDVPALLGQHDIFLLASDYEGLPLSLLEAMGNGLVPVVSDLKSGIPEVVDTNNGCLVSVDDVAGYARAIIHLHAHPNELIAKSANARVRVQKEFSVAAMTDRWLAVFPKRPVSPAVWPKHWRFSAPLAVQNPVHFSRPMRLLRRVAMKLSR